MRRLATKVLVGIIKSVNTFHDSSVTGHGCFFYVLFTVFSWYKNAPALYEPFLRCDIQTFAGSP
jgi:hypothetical protein